MVENCSDGLAARGSWWGMKRIEGRCLDAASDWATCVPMPAAVGVEAGVGPDWLRTVSVGAAVSARDLVMAEGGESGRGAVRTRERAVDAASAASAAARWEEAALGPAGGDGMGGVVVAARGRPLVLEECETGDAVSWRGPWEEAAAPECRLCE